MRAIRRDASSLIRRVCCFVRGARRSLRLHMYLCGFKSSPKLSESTPPFASPLRLRASRSDMAAVEDESFKAGPVMAALTRAARESRDEQASMEESTDTDGIVRAVLNGLIDEIVASADEIVASAAVPSPSTSPNKSSSASPPKKKKPVEMEPTSTMSGMSPQMKRLLRRNMSPEKQRGAAREKSAEEMESITARREERRIVREFWSKQPHGLTAEELRA